jgi:hypothetical protein
MLVGLLQPLLRRFGARTRTLIGAVVMAAGLALIVALAVLGHAPGRSVLLIRAGLLLILAGTGPFASGVRGSRHHRQLQAAETNQPDDPGRAADGMGP